MFSYRTLTPRCRFLLSVCRHILMAKEDCFGGKVIFTLPRSKQQVTVHYTWMSFSERDTHLKPQTEKETPSS